MPPALIGAILLMLNSLTIGFAGYWFAAIAFAALSLVLLAGLRRQKNPRVGVVLIVASLASTAWAVLQAVGVSQSPAPTTFALGADLVRSAFWGAFFVAALRVDQAASRAAWLTPPIAIIGAALLVAAVAVLRVGALTDHTVQSWLLLLMVAASIAGLLAIETLYRATPVSRRWGIKLLVIAAAAMFAYDFVMYSDAALFDRVRASLWDTRGFAHALLVPLIALSAARNPAWSLAVQVSRQFVLTAFTLLAAGVYLVTVATLALFARSRGGEWGETLQTALLFTAFVALAIVGASGKVRSWLRVTVAKHFFSYRYDYRKEWLALTEALSKGVSGETNSAAMIEALAKLVESPGGVLFAARSSRYEAIHHWNVPQADRPIPTGHAFLQFVRERQWVIDLAEVSRASPEYEGLRVPDVLATIPRARVFVPLIAGDDLYGFVVLTEPRVEITFDWEVRDLLKTAARQVAVQLSLAEAHRALIVSRQFESFNRMSAFVVHDLKNLVAQLTLLISNAETHRNNPEFQEDMMSTLDHAVQRMRRMLAQLSVESRPEEPKTVHDIHALLQMVLKERSASRPAPRLEMANGTLRVVGQRDRIVRIIGHVTQNAIDATAATGEVAVRCWEREGRVVVEVEDNGRGMSAAFIRERLFKPFESTKAGGMGLGCYEVERYMREIGGAVEVDSETGRGTRMRLIFPEWKDLPQAPSGVERAEIVSG